MKVKDNFNQDESHVRDVWEIRLDREIITRIRRLSRDRKCTMSWIARYCIFRLVHKKNIHLDEFHSMVAEIKATSLPFHEQGRFYICLYGDDVMWIKIQAGVWGVTVSMLFRVALLRYLATIADTRAVPWWRLFWYGIKLNKRVVLQRMRRHRVLVQEFLIHQPFHNQDYWNIPPGPLPGYMTPH